MVKEKNVDDFIKLVIKDSSYKKYVQRDVITKMIDCFDVSVEKMKYPRNINNCLELALQFYKLFNYEYYKILIKGLADKNIIITDDILKSYTDNNKTYIKLSGTDCDLIIIVHEFAHFLDRILKLIPDKYNILCEVYSFWMERQLEAYLLSQDKSYEELIVVRNNNRLYFEKEILKNIEIMLYYEDLYRQQNFLNKEQIDMAHAKRILNYNLTNVVNYLLRYPLGNILSKYIIENNILISGYDLSEICLGIDLRELLANKNLLNIK